MFRSRKPSPHSSYVAVSVESLGPPFVAIFT